MRRRLAQPGRRTWFSDRAIGIALGIVLGLAIVIAFVFLGSGDTIDAPSLSGGGEEQPATTPPPEPPTQP